MEPNFVNFCWLPISDTMHGAAKLDDGWTRELTAPQAHGRTVRQWELWLLAS